MSENVRLVSDGEEIVSSEGVSTSERMRDTSRSLGRGRQGASAVSKLAVNYRGFHDVQGRREYELDARLGDQTRHYTVWIALAAFSKRQALLQDGPDICYQKLLHELAGSVMEGAESIGITDDDLAAYRERHPLAVRRGYSPPRPEPARAHSSD
jgi:hypothetical protein